LQPLVLHKFLVAGRSDGHRSGRQPKTYVKPEAAITVFELPMMGGVSPEITNFGIINSTTRLHRVGSFCEIYMTWVEGGKEYPTCSKMEEG